MSEKREHKNWGVAWFGNHPEPGTCHRCQRVGRVYRGYNGGQYMAATGCSDCVDPMVRKEA